MTDFCRYELRTKDVAGGRAFYSELLGAEFWSEHVVVVPLPEQVAARGALSHWLGFIDVANVEDMARRIVERGGQRLGPTRQDGDGATRAALTIRLVRSSASVPACPWLAP
jgi:catechol 2,3-dioxygenase-like lactoylglutathione lyase family enzyme